MPYENPFKRTSPVRGPRPYVGPGPGPAVPLLQPAGSGQADLGAGASGTGVPDPEPRNGDSPRAPSPTTPPTAQEEAAPIPKIADDPGEVSPWNLLVTYIANHVLTHYAVETKDKGWVLIKEPLTEGLLHQHLDGDLTLGIYTTSPSDDTARWCCWDLDDMAASSVYSLVSVLDMPFVVEKTGGNGRHVWQFFEAPQPAASVRQYLLAKARQAGLPPEVECFPKQDTLDGGYGNLVRLPFGKSNKTGNWSEVELGEWGFTRLPAVLPYSTPSKAASWPQETRSDQAGTYHTPEAQAWLGRLWQGDATVAGGRNNGLYKLAVWLRARDFPPDAVEMNLRAVNEKFPDPLDEEELSKLLRR